MNITRIARFLPLLAAVIGGLAFAAPAVADTTDSSNWGGYAVHGSKVHFKKVLGTWTQPKATCKQGEPTYSSMWVGIGGYSITAPALEQIGTEADCTSAGRQTSSAWYELVPAASQTIRMSVNAHDRIRASVAVSGREVTVTLNDLTRHRSFSKRVRASIVDTTSAEWILEAPSVCSGGNQCQTLPLADFGSTAFTAAKAQTTAGHTGSIDDRRWTTTKITLSQGGRQFIAGGGSPFATATPSTLRAKNTSFTVTFKGSAGAIPPSETRRQVAASRLMHAPAFLPTS